MEETKSTEMVRLWKLALWLAVITVVYNLVEGLVSTWFGGHDEALTLFGFGIDSFVEVISGAGILAMVLRIRSHPESERSGFERTALRITGGAFYLLAAGLSVTAIYNLAAGQKPATTLPGLIIAAVSILSMLALVWAKRKVGHALHSAPILADANCTLTCVYMSLVLLASSAIYLLSGFGLVDSLGAIGLVYFSVKEGRESFEKARSLGDCCAEGEPAD